MFKITINNEEVLCDKDFKIEEEMLNTSSVILNNVYPKTWEQDKDYVSRFYYPKDYSKCKIFDETSYPGSDGETVEGSSINVDDVDLSYDYNYALLGDTEQNGTPTPSSPITVETTTGRQVVSVCGKNLLPNNATTQTINHVDFTINDDGSILINGTSSATTTLIIGYTYLKAGNYISSIHKEGIVNNSCYFAGINADTEAGISGASLRMDTNNTKPFTINSDTYCYFQLYIGSNRTFTNFKIYPMVESGSTASDYEAYNGNTYEINLGKNLFDKNLEVYSTFESSIATALQNYKDTGKIAKGYPDIPANNRLLNNASYTTFFIPVIEGETYTVSCGSGKNFAQIFMLDDTGNIISYSTRWISTPYIHTVSSQEKYMLIGVKSDTLDTARVVAETIELCKIGDYRDRIFYNTEDSPYYDSNLNEAWYLHKEIGKTTDTSGSVSITINDMLSNGEIYSYYGGTVSGTTITYDKAISGSGYIYYQLATSTDTRINDEDLLNTLNDIRLLSGTNNISITSADLPAIMKLKYNYYDPYTIEDIYFCGVVENTGNISLNPRYPHYCNLQVLDFKTFLSEGETLDFVIMNKTVEEAIDQVINAVSEYGFIKGNINLLNPTEVIGAYSTKDKTAYDVFNYIADITQSRWTTRMIDEDTVAIDFYDPSLMTQGTAIEYNNTWFNNNKIIDMAFNYSSKDYRNKQVMTSSEVYGNISQQETKVADGYRTQFNTYQKIGVVNSIYLDGISQTFATNEEKDLGNTADFYYSTGNNYFESDATITAGSSIVINYTPIIEGRQVIADSSEISRVNTMTNRKGIVARYENRNDATTSNELQKIGQSYIKYKGTPEITLKVQSLNNIWNIGDSVSFTTAPLTELQTDFMVKKKTTNYIKTQDEIFFTYELTSSFNSETAINYFDNQRSKANGNIGAGEYVSRNIDIENVGNIIFYDYEAEEITIDGDNTLNSVLNAPFIS